MSGSAEPWVAEIGQLLHDPSLPITDRLMCLTAAAVAVCDEHKSRVFLGMALDNGLTVLQAKEIVLQSYLFCGFPVAIEGLLVYRECLRQRGLEDENYIDHRIPVRIRDDGEQLCRRIYGRNFEKLMMNMGKLSTNLSEWMINEGYGKVLSRPVMGPRERELCVVCALAALGRERQLLSHLKGALHVGATPDELRAALQGNRMVVSTDRVDWSIRCLDKVVS